MTSETQTRIERLLALLVVEQMGEKSMTEKSLALLRAGLTSAEIAELLGTTRLVINQLVYLSRKAKKSKAVRKVAKR